MTTTCWPLAPSSHPLTATCCHGLTSLPGFPELQVTQSFSPLLIVSPKEVLVREMCRLHGLPADIVLDQGPQFISCFWREFCNLLDISISLSSGFLPQMNGQRANQEVDTKLHLLCEDDPCKWSANLPWVEHALSSLPSSVSGLSPFYIVYGFQPLMFTIQGKAAEIPSAHRGALRCHWVWKRTRKALIKMSSICSRCAS